METAPLFERLGGRDVIRAVVEKALTKHYDNDAIRRRFENAEQSYQTMVDHAVEFFCTGLSGIETYAGRPLAEAHKGMNVSEQEFIAAIDDIVDAMVDVGVGDQERLEVTGVLYGMKADVIRQ